MSSKAEQIAELLRRIAASANGAKSFVAKVKAVDTNNYTCDVEPIDGGAMYNDVRLKPVVDSDDHGMIAIPEVDSHVIVEPLMGSDVYLYVSKFTKVTTYLIKNSNGVKMLFNSNGELHLNGDANGSLINIASLLQKVNQFITTFNAHTHSVSGSSTGPQTGAPVQSITASDIENNKVKHGNG